MKKISYLILIFFFSNCVIIDPITIADYYITNNTTADLIITAKYLFSYDLVIFETDRVNPKRKEYVYTFREGSGGHVKPSNVFHEFIIYSDSIDSNNLIYSGIINEDWKHEGLSNDGHLIYNLTIE